MPYVFLAFERNLQLSKSSSSALAFASVPIPHEEDATDGASDETSPESPSLTSSPRLAELVELTGFEPVTSALQGRRSPS